MKYNLFRFVLFLFLVAFIFPQRVDAHPLDEIGNVKVYDQKQTLLLEPKTTELRIDLTFYATEKIKVWESIDKNRDQHISDEEKNDWMRKGEDASYILADNSQFNFQAKGVNFPVYEDFFSQKPVHVTIEFILQGTILPEHELFYFYKGKDKKLDEITVEIKGSDEYKIKNVSKKDSESVSFIIEEGTGNTSHVLNVISGDRINQFLTRYVKPNTISFPLLLISFLVSFLLGAIHAMTPGHGKALVAGYLVGERGTIRHAIQLGGIITITHTSSVFILGIFALLLTEYIVPTTVIMIMNRISGIAIVCIGIILLIKRIKGLTHSNSQFHDRSDMHDHHHEHENHHTHEIPDVLSFKSLLALGVSGGIVPCADALVILVVAMSLQKILLGLVLLLFFSLGLASALCITGILVVIAKNKAQDRFANLVSYQKYISIASAIIVILFGVSLLLFS